MDKLLRFTKIAALCCLILAMINAILGYTPYEWWNSKITTFVYAAIAISEWLLIILFCSMIYNNSVVKSPLRYPSLLGLISAIVGVVIRTFMHVLSSMQVFEIIDAVEYSIYTTCSCVDSVVIVGILISFIWMSKYMKGNDTKTFCISYLIFLSMKILFSWFGIRVLVVYFNDYDIISSAYRMISVTISTLTTLALSIFYYSFSKMLNK